MSNMNKINFTTSLGTNSMLEKKKTYRNDNGAVDEGKNDGYKIEMFRPYRLRMK